MPLHWNGDVKSVDKHRTTQIVPQDRLHNFYMDMSSGECDAAMLEGAQDQTRIIPHSSFSQSDHYVLSEHPLNQSRISYDRYSY